MRYETLDTRDENDRVDEKRYTLNTNISILNTNNIQPLKIKLQPWKMTKS